MCGDSFAFEHEPVPRLGETVLHLVALIHVAALALVAARTRATSAAAFCATCRANVKKSATPSGAPGWSRIRTIGGRLPCGVTPVARDSDVAIDRPSEAPAAAMSTPHLRPSPRLRWFLAPLFALACSGSQRGSDNLNARNDNNPLPVVQPDSGAPIQDLFGGSRALPDAFTANGP